MPDFLFLLILIAATVAGLAAAVDAARQHPVLWEQAGRSMILRFFVFLSPLLSFFLLPVGIGITAHYFTRARPALVAAGRRRAAAGHPPVTGGSLGIGMTWRELSAWQKAKAVVAFLSAVALEVMIFAGDSGPGLPLIGTVLAAPVLLVFLFLAVYLGLSIATVMIPLLLSRPAGKLVNDKQSLRMAKRRSDRQWQRDRRRW